MKARIFVYIISFVVVGSLHAGWWSYTCNGANIELIAYEGGTISEQSMSFSIQDWSIKLDGDEIQWKTHLLRDTEVKAILDRADYRSVSIYFPKPSFKEDKSGFYSFKTQVILEENKDVFQVQKFNLDCHGVKWVKH